MTRVLPPRFIPGLGPEIQMSVARAHGPGLDGGLGVRFQQAGSGSKPVFGFRLEIVKKYGRIGWEGSWDIDF